MRLLKVETGWVGVSPSPVVLVRLPLVVVVAQLASLVVLPLPNPNRTLTGGIGTSGMSRDITSPVRAL